MGIFLSLAFLFFMGSLFGWLLEVVYRNANSDKSKWINPGFCTGPYVPLYGCGLCVLYLLASLEQYNLIENPILNKIALFIAMALGMTVLEYLTGVVCIKFANVRLWDYSKLPGNIQGIICPKFSMIWAMFSAIYYFAIHKHILSSLDWLANNLAFSFVIGLFFGIFIIDVVHSADLVIKIKLFAKEHDVIVKYENIKSHIRSKKRAPLGKLEFFQPFRSNIPLNEHLREMYRKKNEH